MSEQPVPDPQPALSKRAKIITAAVLVVLFGWAMIGNSSSDSTDEPEPAFSRTDAWMACKEGVKERLNNPATADFSLLSTSISDPVDGWYEIAGSLTSENDFGVEAEIAFSCRVKEGQPIEVEVAETN